MSNHTCRILIFTGAGASYGCEHVLPKQPPLSNQLYDELSACFPDSWGRTPTALASQFRTNFEGGMDVVWQRQSLNVPPLMRDMAIYFSSFHPDGQRLDLYSRLIENIVQNNLQEQTVLSTINYDCILELAVSSLGLRIDYFSINGLEMPKTKEERAANSYSKAFMSRHSVSR